MKQQNSVMPTKYTSCTDDLFFFLLFLFLLFFFFFFLFFKGRQRKADNHQKGDRELFHIRMGQWLTGNGSYLPVHCKCFTSVTIQ